MHTPSGFRCHSRSVSMHKHAWHGPAQEHCSVPSEGSIRPSDRGASLRVASGMHQRWRPGFELGPQASQRPTLASRRLQCPSCKSTRSLRSKLPAGTSCWAVSRAAAHCRPTWRIAGGDTKRTRACAGSGPQSTATLSPRRATAPGCCRAARWASGAPGPGPGQRRQHTTAGASRTARWRPPAAKRTAALSLARSASELSESLSLYIRQVPHPLRPLLRSVARHGAQRCRMYRESSASLASRVAPDARQAPRRAGRALRPRQERSGERSVLAGARLTRPLPQTLRCKRHAASCMRCNTRGGHQIGNFAVLLASFRIPALDNHTIPAKGTTALPRCRWFVVNHHACSTHQTGATSS